MAIPIKNLEALISRQPLSDFLPYICYEDGIYMTADNSLGFILESDPLPSAGVETLNTLRSIYELRYPVDTTIQITTYASPNISWILRDWAGRRIGYQDGDDHRFKGLFRELARHRFKFLNDGTRKSLLSAFDYRIRNFRNFISVKIPVKDGNYDKGMVTIKQLELSISQLLRTIKIHTMNLNPRGLNALLYEILQPNHDQTDPPGYDQRFEIRKQIIFTDNKASVEKEKLTIDKHVYRSMTVKQYPSEIYLWNMTNLIGDMFQNIKQITSPFLLTLNVIIPDRETLAVVAAASGSGKSYFINELAISYLGTGGQVWIIDVGRSYLKLAEVLGGEFIVFSDESDICLNPFSNIINIDEELSLLKPLLAQMASPSRQITDIENAFLEQSIKKAFEEKGQETTITDISNKLNALKDDRAKDLCQMLFPYTKKGIYGKFFEGKNNLKFENPFIVLELEELKSKKDMQSVVLLLLLYSIQQKMYLGDRNKRKIVIIDEAWDLIGEGNTGKFIEGGYRRFRKYGGAAITVTQSIADFFKISSGEAILANSDFMFYLRQKPESLKALKDDSKIMMDDYQFTLLSSVHTIGGQYSEIFVHSPMGWGIGRLIVDPFSNLLYTTNPKEYAMVKRLTDQGLSVSEAIKKCLKK